MKNYFPKRFSIVLKESNFTYEEIGRKLRKSKSTISKYASGTIKTIDISMVVKIAEIFDVSPIWLLGFTKNRHYKIKDK